LIIYNIYYISVADILVDIYYFIFADGIIVKFIGGTSKRIIRNDIRKYFA